MKRPLLLFLPILFLISMTGCSGYNGIMRDHLGDKDNYYAVDATLCSYKEVDDKIYLYVTVEDKSSFDLSEATSERITLELVGDNCAVLREFLATEEIRVGDSISVRCSTWIYMDSTFYYVAAIAIQYQTFLSFDDGLNNIIKYMDDHKSVL